MTVPDRHAALESNVKADLRRRVRRDHAAQLVDRAAHLPPADRALIEAVYRDGRPVSEIAELLSQNPRTLRRRVRALTRRLASPRFLFVLHHRDLWPTTRRRVATACVLEGRSLRDTARALSLTLHNVRRHRVAIEAAYETVVAAARHPASAAAPGARSAAAHVRTGPNP